MTQLVYRIKDLEAHPQGIHLAEDLDRPFLMASLAEAGIDVDSSNVHLETRLLLQGPNVLCQGGLSGRLMAVCQRCLSPAELPLDLSLRTIFVPPGASTPDEELVDPDDEDYAHHNRDVVDLREVLREQLLLSIPIAILCKEDCLGLCPTCGVDKNVAPCSCAASVSLSPFAVLKKLKH